MNAQPNELETLKDRLKATWSAGDYGRVARGLERSAEDFLERIGVAAGDDLLDVACGTGQIAIPAARTGAHATGLDLAEPWIDRARERAAEEGLDIRFDVGDAERMPYDDARFDVVVSLIGVMFAPRPEVVTAELLRVCRPGGRIVLGNWTPEGFIGRFFRTVAGHVPPPDMPSPLLWGNEDAVRERLGPHVSELRLARRNLHFDYAMGPADLTDHFIELFGPTKMAWDALDAAGRSALKSDLVELWDSHNEATDGSTRLHAEILKVVAVR